MVGEGIETCLSVMQATGNPAWAALSTSGLRSLDLPRGVRDVIVLADGDKPGEDAAQDCARRWKREGRRVRIARPPTGMDFNDLLIANSYSLAKSLPEELKVNDDAKFKSDDGIADAINDAEEVHDPAASEERGEKPRLLVENCSPDQTVATLRSLLADAGGLYDRGVPVRLAFDQIQRGTVAQIMTPDALVLMAHTICRPYVLKAGSDGTIAEVDARLPRSLAVMYLDWRGEWRLPR